MTTIEQMLGSAGADPYSDSWDQLFEQVRHVGISDADRTLLIERLPGIAAGCSAADRDNVLFLAGHIAADLDEASWPQFSNELETLHALAGDWLTSPKDPELFLYRLQAVAALEGDELWGAELHRIDEDEIEIECPGCGTTLLVVFGDAGHFATHDDSATKPGIEKTPLLPAGPTELDGAGQRLYQTSLRAGRTTVATALTYLFGRAECTQCNTIFRVSDQVFRY
ncbi:hypothetical protein [Paractinoplanes toevensis]|uniref:hypothetical protein n=1 Tax=Paractinoplanes toevensis TaxID=571911 RepID=UPI001BB3B5FC|nr:hypothetical protein [Actinoplanes toevensis]